MTIIFLLFELTICWKYPTFDELNVQCSICIYITNRFKNKTDGIDEQIIPLEGSICEKDKENEICKNIESIALNYKNATNQTNYCIRTGFCPDEVPSGFIGQRCKICMMLSKHILLYPVNDRKVAFHNFCNTSNLITSLFCGDIYDESVDDYLIDIEDIKDPFKFCQVSYFCRENPKIKDIKNYDNGDL